MDGLAAARARGRTGGQKPKLGPRQVALARSMYAELGEDGKRTYTVEQIAAEFGVTRPTIYRHLAAAPQRNSRHGKPIRPGDIGRTRERWWVDQKCHHGRHRSQGQLPGRKWSSRPDRDPVAQYADRETASIPTELDFDRYRHTQEVTDSMSIET